MSDKKYVLNNISSYKEGNGNSIFFLINDEKLIEITGADIHILGIVIDSLKEGEKTLLQIEKKINGKISKQRIKECIDILVQNEIVLIISNNKLIKKYIIIGDNEKIGNTIDNELNTDRNIEYSFIKYVSFDCISDENYKDPNIDFVIIFGSLYENYNQLIEINKYYFNKNIPIIYFSVLKKNIVELGPICHKEMETACLESFLKRKLNNLKNPFEFIRIINLNLEKIYKRTDKYAIELCLTILKKELNNYFTLSFSNLLSTNFEIDLNSLEISKSIVLEVHNLTYKPSTIISPFD